MMEPTCSKRWFSPPNDVEDKDPVFNGCAEVSQTVSHGLELAAVLIDRDITLNKSTKDSNRVPGPPSEDPPRWSC
jgi:hypothetical protein